MTRGAGARAGGTATALPAGVAALTGRTGRTGRTGLLGRHVRVELTDGSTVEGRMHEMGFDALEVEIATGHVRAIVPETVAHVRAV